MFLVNSRLGQFSAAPLLGHPLSLSYGVILPSSLTTVLSLALGYSPHPPVSVCGTGTFNLDRDFSRQCEISCFATLVRSPSYPSINQTDLPIWSDRKSTRLNSSHANISYAVFCLKKNIKPSVSLITDVADSL